jgi:hypothetical protein
VIWVRVQAHPSRKDLLPDLVDRLRPLPVEIRQHSSIPPDPWSGYVECLKNLPDCSHILIIQDDAIPCEHFPEALMQVADRHPSTPVCLYLGASPASTAAQARRAMMKERRYTPLLNTTFVPLVAVLWPKRVAEDFLDWSRHAKTTRADDGNAARWMKRAKQPFLVTVPSLVQHNESVPSVKGSDNRGNWCSALFLAQDALDYVW